MSKHKPKHIQNNHPPKPHQDGGGKESTNRHVYVEPGVQIDLVEDLKQEYKSAQSNNTAHNKKQLFWAKVSSGLILIYVLVAGYQGYLTRDIANISRDQAMDSRAALESVQRAFVAYNGIESKIIRAGEPKGETIWTLSVIWKNLGATPANIIGGQFENKKLPHEPDEKAFRGINPLMTGPVIGQGEVQKMGGIRIPQSQIFPELSVTTPGTHEYKVSEITFFWGWIVYRDIFPNTKPHLTEFCDSLIGATGKVKNPSESTVEPKYARCDAHNCRDEDCSDYKSILEIFPSINGSR